MDLMTPGHRREPHKQRRAGPAAVRSARRAARLEVVPLGRPRPVARQGSDLRSGRQSAVGDVPDPEQLPM